MMLIVRSQWTAFLFAEAFWSCFGLRADAQSTTETDRVQAVIEGIRMDAQSTALDQWLMTRPGVINARTSYNTRNVVLEVWRDCDMGPVQLQQALQAMGFSMRCFRRTSSALPFSMLDPRTCDDLPPAIK